MKRARHMERDGYHVLDWQGEHSLCIADIWEQFPELVVGRYLVNTSFDSGFITLSDSERQDGWRMVGRLAHSPRIHRATQIPHDQFDEWLVFDRPTQVDEFETMVNRCYFSPIGIELQEEQERFWEQVVRLKPSHLIAENYGVYLVSRDEDLIVKIMNSDVRGRSVVE